jgi:hypothetical protein
MILDKIKKYSTYILLAVILLLSICLYFYVHKSNNLVSQNDLETAYNTKVISKYDKDLKSVVSSKEALEADNSNLSKFLKDKDSELFLLKKKKKASIGAIISDSIIVEGKAKHDTLYVENDGKFFFIDTISNKNYLAIIKANQDSTRLSLKAFNKKTFFITRKKNKSIINVADSNPIIVNQDIKGYVLKDKPKNGKFIVGLILGIAATVYILK